MAGLRANLKSGIVVFLAAGVMALSSGSAFAQSVRLLGDFQDWSSYATSEGSGKLCFALSKPVDMRPEVPSAGQAYLYLTHRPSENVLNEINYIAGFTLAPETPVTLRVGSQTYELFVETDAGWLDNVAESENLAGNMRAGSSLTVEATTADGVMVTQTFSLSGVTAASRAIDRECK